MVFALVLITLSLYALFPSFGLGLYGDDWLVLWRYFHTSSPLQSIFLNNITHFFLRYGSFEAIMGLLVQIVGYQSIYFYITAYILRLIASLSFYPLVVYLTSNKLSAAFAVIFFSVATSGIDATNWVFNMPIYIAISFLNLFFLFYVKSEMENSIRFFLISLIFFTLAVIFASVRMTGLIPAVFLMELFWLIRIHNFKRIKQFVTRLAIFLTTFILIVLIGQVIALYINRKGYELVGTLDNLFGIWKGGLSAGGNLLTQGKLDFVLSPLIIIGNMLLPIDVTASNRFIFIIIGGTTITFGLRLILVNLKNHLIATGLFLSLAWMVLSFFFAWFKDPQVLLPITHRYLIVSIVGIIIFTAILISFVKNILQKKLLLLFFSLLILINIYSTRKYLEYQVDNLHGAQLTEKIWSQIPYIPEIGKTKDPIVFYFTGENKQVIYGSITFGFPVHMALWYKLDDFSKMPNPVDSFDQVVSAVTDGKSLAPFGLSMKPIPIENVYAFKLVEKDNLVNISDQIRLELSKIRDVQQY